MNEATVNQVEEGRNRIVCLDEKKISRKAAVEKGLDYFIDLAVFYGAFIALSLWWTHERIRDYAILD